MKVLVKFVFKNIKENRQWALMTVMGIAISVMMITTVVMFGQGSYEAAKEAVIPEGEEWNARVVTQYPDVPKSEYLDAYTVESLTGYILNDEGMEISDVYEYDFLINKNVTTLPEVKGRLPFNENEIALGVHNQNDLGEKHIGDFVQFKNSKGEIKELEIVGFQLDTTSSRSFEQEPFDRYAMFLKFDSNIPDLEQEILKMFNDEMEELNYNETLNQILGITEYKDPLFLMMSALVLSIVAIISLASIALIYNAFNLSIESKVKQIGLLQSVGATKKQISRMVYLEGFVLSLIGITLGIILGYGLAHLLTTILTHRFSLVAISDVFIVPKVRMDVIAIIYILGLLSVFLPIRKGVKRANRISVIDTMRQSKDFVVSLKDKSIDSSKNIVSSLAKKNVQRNKSRNRGTGISLIITIVILISVNSFASIMLNQVRLNNSNVRYDVVVSQSQSFDSKETYHKLVNSLDSTLFNEAQITESVSTYLPDTFDLGPDFEPYIAEGFAKESLINFVFISDSEYESFLKKYDIRIENGGELINNNFFGKLSHTDFNKVGVNVDLKMGDLKQGDSIEYLSLDGEAMQSFKIGALTEHDVLGYSRYEGIPSFTAIVPESRRNTYVPERIGEVTSLYFTSDHHKELVNAIRDFDSELDVFDQLQDKNIVDAIGGVISFMIYIIGGFVVLICISNVINVSVSGMRLRRRDHAILRSVGMSSKGIRSMLTFEALFTAIKPLVIGVITGVGLTYAMYRLARSFIIIEAFSIDIKAILASCLIIFVVLGVNVLYSVNYARKEVIIEDLRERGTL